MHVRGLQQWVQACRHVRVLLCLQRKIRELQEQLDTAKRQHHERTSTLEKAVADVQQRATSAEAKLRTKMEELVALGLQYRERTRSLERAVADVQRQKADAEAQAQRYLEELRAAPGSAGCEAEKKELEEQLANEKRRAEDEQRWRIRLTEKVTQLEFEKEAAEEQWKAEVQKWQDKFVEQEAAATRFGRHAVMHELRTDEAQKLSNDKFREVFDAVALAYDRGLKERQRRELVEAERQR